MTKTDNDPLTYIPGLYAPFYGMSFQQATETTQAAPYSDPLWCCGGVATMCFAPNVGGRHATSSQRPTATTTARAGEQHTHGRTPRTQLIGALQAELHTHAHTHLSLLLV